MTSTNYFQDASRPYMPSTPRLSSSSTFSEHLEKYGHYYAHGQYQQPTGYHGLGISGIPTPLISVVESSQSSISTSSFDSEEEEEEHDQLKIPTPVDEDMMTMAHDRSRHRRAASKHLRDSNQALKQIMFAASDLTSDDRRSRRSIVTPRSISYMMSSPKEICASRSSEDLRDSQDFWKICLKIRKTMAYGDRERERQLLLTTPHCCNSCGTPVTPVVFTPSKSFEVVGAWKESTISH